MEREERKERMSQVQAKIIEKQEIKRKEEAEKFDMEFSRKLMEEEQRRLSFEKE